MALLRALAILFALLTFFLVAVPVQMLVARRAPQAAQAVPLFFCRSLLRLLRVRLVIEGTPATRAALLAANHVSWIDILCLGAVAPFCFLAKVEVSRWPLLSAFARVQGTVFVDRARRRSIIPANATMADRLAAGRSVLIFPEGTTRPPPEPAPFKSSHFAAAREVLRRGAATGRIEVQPVAIGYSSASAAWVDDAALLPHIWHVLRTPPLTCRVGFGAPMAYEIDTDRKHVAQAARQCVLALLAQQPAAAADRRPARSTDLIPAARRI